jgi:hypothetical protein
MAGKNTAVFGIFATAVEAERGVDTLIAAGFPSADISVLLPDTRATKDFAHQKDTKAPEGTTAGVTAGGIVGGALGVLAGMGALAIPGVGPLIAAGPIMAGLAGLGVGGAVGGLVGALVGMGIPEYEAKLYEGRVKNGGVPREFGAPRICSKAVARMILPRAVRARGLTRRRRRLATSRSCGGRVVGLKGRPGC